MEYGTAESISIRPARSSGPTRPAPGHDGARAQARTACRDAEPMARITLHRPAQRPGTRGYGRRERAGGRGYRVVRVGRRCIPPPAAPARRRPPGGARSSAAPWAPRRTRPGTVCTRHGAGRHPTGNRAPRDRPSGPETTGPRISSRRGRPRGDHARSPSRIPDAGWNL